MMRFDILVKMDNLLNFNIFFLLLLAAAFTEFGKIIIVFEESSETLSCF